MRTAFKLVPQVVARMIVLASVSAFTFSGYALSVSAEPLSTREANRIFKKAKSMAQDLTAANATEMMKMAIFLDGNNYTHECREICQLVCNSRFATAECWARLAGTYLSGLGDEGKSKPAKQCLEKAISMNPKSAYVNAVVTQMAMEEGRYEDAIVAADKAIACSHPLGHIYQLKASALANLGRDKEALGVIEKAPKDVVSKDPAYWRIRGNIQENLKKYSDAAESYRKALVLGDTDVINFRLVKCLEFQNKLPEAIGEISKVIRKNPKDGDAYRVRASLKVKNKDLAGAIKDYDSCLLLEPTVKSYKDRAKLHALMGHKEQAQKDLNDAKSLEERL